MGAGGFAKRWSYLISLFSKSDDKGGGGQKSQKIDDVIYERPLTQLPKLLHHNSKLTKKIFIMNPSNHFFLPCWFFTKYQIQLNTTKSQNKPGILKKTDLHIVCFYSLFSYISSACGLSP